MMWMKKGVSVIVALAIACQPVMVYAEDVGNDAVVQMQDILTEENGILVEEEGEDFAVPGGGEELILDEKILPEEPIADEEESLQENSPEEGQNSDQKAEEGQIEIGFETESEAGWELEILSVEEAEMTADGAIIMQGAGTKADPYVVETAQQMNSVRNNLEAYYVLGKDIDLSSYANWEAIGTEAEPFTGVFDGQNHTISGLKITGTDSVYAGLFGVLNGEKSSTTTAIKNLNITDVSINISDDYVTVGIIAALIYGSYGNKVYNCRTEGKINITDGINITAGGITGSGGTIDSCTNYADLHLTGTRADDRGYHGTIECGGISGFRGTIVNCRNYGKIEAFAGNFVDCGGICGDGGSIQYSENYGDIYAETMYHDLVNSSSVGGERCKVGGIVGECADFSDTEYCINYGNVNGKTRGAEDCIVGGIAARKMLWNGCGIRHCYNLGASITAVACKEEDGVWKEFEREAGRICVYATVQEECYSLDTTLVNGKIPTEDTSADKRNGGSLSAEEMQQAITGNYAGNDRIIATFPERGETGVNPALYGAGYDITVCFDDVVTKGNGYIGVINLYTDEVQWFGVEYDTRVSTDENVLTISGVQLPYDTCISVVFESGCVNVGGKPFYGLSDESDWTFTTQWRKLTYGLNFQWGIDNFSFVNSDAALGVQVGTRYVIDEALIENSNFSVTDQYLIRKELEKWGGSCFGISCTALQLFTGGMSLSQFQSGARTTFELKMPAANQALKNYLGLYQGSVKTSKYQNARAAFGGSLNDKLKFLVAKLKETESTGVPILVDYAWVKDPEKAAFFSTEGWSAHAVLAYALEMEGAPYVYEGKKYAYWVRVMDPNVLYTKGFSIEEANEKCIYINQEMNDFYIPNAGTRAGTNNSYGLKPLAGEGNEYGEAVIQFVTDDVSILPPTESDAEVVYDSIVTAASLIKIDGHVINCANCTGNGIIGYALNPCGTAASATIFVDRSAHTVEILDDAETVGFRSSGTYQEVSASDNSTVTFQSGSLKLENKSGRYTVTYVSDQTIPQIDSHFIAVSGSGEKEITIRETDDGLAISGEELQGTLITTGSGEEYTVTSDAKEITVSKNSDDMEKVHAWSAWTVAQQPSCTGTGISVRICGNCGGKEYQTIPAKGHTWGEWQTTASATVFAAESQERCCSFCGQKESRTVGVKLSPTIKLNATKLPLKVKQSTTKVKVSNLAAGDSVVSWKSSNTKIVKVNSAGKITAQKKTGKANIIVTLASGKTAVVNVTVQKSVVQTTKISGLSSKITLKKGAKKTLNPVITPITSLQKVTYKSSNKKVATVSSKGVITAKKEGKAKITVTSGKKKYVVTVTVPKVTTTGIKNIQPEITVKKGKKYSLKPKLVPANSSDKVAYTSSNKKVATVNTKGQIIGKKKGTATITIKSGKVSVKCRVTVK